MFNDIINEAMMDKSIDIENHMSKMKEMFKDNQIKTNVGQMLISSHDYKGDLHGIISFLNNYKWKEKEMRVDRIQGLDKPTNNDKVLEISNSFKKNGNINKDPLITVDALHGISPQSEKHAIMFDGHHRHKGLLFTGIDKTPVYHGTYIHGNIEELEDQDNDSIVTESFFSKSPPPTPEFYNKSISIINAIRIILPSSDIEWVFEIEKFNILKKKEKRSLHFNLYNPNKELYSKLEEDYNDTWKNAGSKVKNVLISKGFKITQYAPSMIIEFENVKLKIAGSFHMEDKPASITFHYIPKLNESSTAQVHLFESSKLDKIELTGEERSAVNKKYGKVDCSFYKNAKTGKYLCMTHRAGSKEYDLPTDIPIGTVKFVSSTS